MTYNPSIPQATDLISNSQAQILANFSQLNTQFGVDHVAFNTGSGNGDGTHKHITFDNAPTEPTVSGTISSIFPLLVGSNQELFFKNAGSEYNATGKTQITGPSLLASEGYAFLPGGLLLKWGTFSGGGGATTHTLPSGGSIPAFSAVYAAYVNGADNASVPNTFVTLQLFTTTNIKIYGSSRTTTSTNGVTVYYLMLGK